ncbi:MAG: 50S ribosomal protein L9 [Candidatus Lindowbacteria bacterium]|nr:50S ribosomal protein L9 [Candidatus Lindowbacteria bacterium]
MKVILKETIDHLGEVGDVINVKDGFARNFLLPRGKCVTATDAELKRRVEQEKKVNDQKSSDRENAKSEAEKLAGVTITAEVKVSDEDQMYGSVGVTEIVDLMGKAGFKLEKRQVLLPEPIKELGTHKVSIRYHQEVTVEVELNVVKEKTE